MLAEVAVTVTTSVVVLVEESDVLGVPVDFEVVERLEFADAEKVEFVAVEPIPARM